MQDTEERKVLHILRFELSWRYELGCCVVLWSYGLLHRLALFWVVWCTLHGETTKTPKYEGLDTSPVADTYRSFLNTNAHSNNSNVSRRILTCKEDTNLKLETDNSNNNQNFDNP
jgi:hypothetical protein